MNEMTPRKRLITAFRGGAPDRVPCYPSLTRWARTHYGCVCPKHQCMAAEHFGFDPLLLYGAYMERTVSNDYVYAPGGGYNYNAFGLGGDLENVNSEIKIENKKDQVWYYRRFETPAGSINDVIQWAKPHRGYGDGPNPHRVEPLVKDQDDLEALSFLYPPPRKDVVEDFPLIKSEIGERGVLAAQDTLNAGSWGMESLGPEGMLVASVEDPDLLQGVCKIGQKAHLKNLKLLLERGAEAVFDSWFQCGPSVGWPPKVYEQVFLPLIAESVELTHRYDAVYIHQDDGKQADIIPHLVEIEVDVLGGLQPPEVGDVVLADVKKQYGTRVCLYGGLDPCYTFEVGTEVGTEDDKDEASRRAASATRAVLDAAMEGGAYVVGTGESVSPNVTEEALFAVAETVKEYGIYR